MNATTHAVSQMPGMQVWYGSRMNLSRSALFRGRHFRDDMIFLAYGGIFGTSSANATAKR